MAFHTNAEAQQVAAALSRLAPLFKHGIYSHAAYEQIKQTVQENIIENHQRVRHEISSGRSPEEICLGAIVAVAFRDISSGRDHIYRGVLSGLGAGKRAVWETAWRELLKSGSTTQEIFDAWRLELENTIRDTG